MVSKRDYHRQVFEKFHIDTLNNTYEECVHKLIYMYLDACKQIELSNREQFKQEIQRLMKRTN